MSSNPSKQPREWFTDTWTTTAFTPLQGWTNLFLDEDGGEAVTAPCPGVLLQELRARERHREQWHDSHGWSVTSHEEPLPPPYETRAVFADHDGGELDPANGVSNYRGTVQEGRADS